jgi:hypothetical protein
VAALAAACLAVPLASAEVVAAAAVAGGAPSTFMNAATGCGPPGVMAIQFPPGVRGAPNPVVGIMEAKVVVSSCEHGVIGVPNSRRGV